MSCLTHILIAIAVHYASGFLRPLCHLPISTGYGHSKRRTENIPSRHHVPLGNRHAGMRIPPCILDRL
jgi:hypothetical protein